MPMARMIKLRVWLIAVARAAPPTPIPAPKEARRPPMPTGSPALKIRIGSRIRFTMAPEASPNMEKRALPCIRSWLFMTMLPIIRGAASRMYCMYRTHCSRVSSVLAPSTQARRRRSTSPAAASSSPSITAKKKPAAAMFSASFRSRRPKAREM